MVEEKKLRNAQVSRRDILKWMGGAAGMAALAACAPPAAPAAAPTTAAGGEEEAAEPAAAPIQMSVVGRREYFKEMEDLFQQAVNEWASENNVDMEVSTIAAEANEDFVAKTLAQVEAGNPPDLIYHTRLTQQLYFLDTLQSVSDAVAEAMDLYGEPTPGHYLQNQIDGEWWGIPYINGGGGKFVRASVFEDAGIDPLEGLLTWDNIRSGCLSVSDPAAEMYGWGMTVNRGGDATGLVQGILHGWGAHITDEDITELTFNSPEAVEAVAWLTDVYVAEMYADMLPPGILSWTDSSNNEAYLAGNIAYTSNAASVYAKAKADGNPVFEDTLVTDVPVGPTGEQLIGGGGSGQFYVPKGAENVEEAKKLALHLLTPDVFLPISLVSAGLFLPCYEDYLAMSEVQAAFEADPNLGRMAEQQTGDYPGLSWPAPPNPFVDAINAQAILTDMMSQTIAQGMSPEDAVAQAADRMSQIADEMGVFG